MLIFSRSWSAFEAIILKMIWGEKTKCFVCRCQCVCQRRGDREAEEKEVIIVGGMMFTSGPAWANGYIVCFACMCVCVRACVSVHTCLNTVDWCDSLVLWHVFHFSLHPLFFSDSISFLNPSLLHFATASWSHLSSSSSHSVHSALQIRPPTQNRGHTHMAKGKCCEE